MKKRSILLFIFSLLFLLTSLSTASQAADIYNKLKDLYDAADYPAYAQLLEKRIEELETKPEEGNRKINNELYKRTLALAHVYAWKLDRFNDGIAAYERALELRQERDRATLQEKLGPYITTPGYEYIFVGGMYERLEDYSNALEYYQKTLPDEVYNKKIREIGMTGNDYVYFVQYTIDNIHRKLPSAKTHTPLTKKIDLIHNSNPMMLSLMLTSFFPEINNTSGHENLEPYIKASSATTYSMLQEYSMLLAGTTNVMGDSSRQDINAYINKYPESYCALTLRYVLAQYYQSNGDEKKAKAYTAEIKKAARERGIELIIEPDKKFATPESTWEALRKAMIKGDIEEAVSCHIPGDPKYQEVYNKFGPEILKKIGADMKPIEKIRSDEQTAKYRANRMHKDIDTEITYYIYFVNINGEWKIESM